MAGQSLGAHAPLSPFASVPAPKCAPLRVLASSRTRRNHGVFMIGGEIATVYVYSSRRVANGQGVVLTVGNGSLVLAGNMLPTQARAIARALTAAATAADAQRGAA